METKNLAEAMQHLRRRRLIHGIAGRLLCSRAALDRSRLSDLERGYALPTDEEVARLQGALDELVTTQAKVERFATSLGWPTGVFGIGTRRGRRTPV